MNKLYHTENRDDFFISVFVLIERADKRSFGYWFVQIFHCLHIRALYCRGRVSRPDQSSLSICEQKKLQLLVCANISLSAHTGITTVGEGFPLPSRRRLPGLLRNPAYPSRLGDACKRLRICKSLPSRRRRQNLKQKIRRGIPAPDLFFYDLDLKNH